VRERIQALPPGQGFVLDGYPRTAAEARSLKQSLAQIGRLEPRPLVLWLDVPRDALLRRLRRRRALEGRADDAEDAIARRLATHDAHAQAVREALDCWAEVIVIDGDRPADAVTESIQDGLRARGYEMPDQPKSTAVVLINGNVVECAELVEVPDEPSPG
jgi:adenylate kinase